MKLTGRQFEQFSAALRDAFPINPLRRMLRYRLDRRLDDISLAGDYVTVVFDLISAAEAEGWTLDLLAAARASNPGNADLLAFAQQFGLAPAGLPPRPELERIIVQTNSYLDISQWRTRLGEIETRVCRVEAGAGAFGTGFLVGPDVVLTNQHVIAPLLAGDDGGPQPGDVALRFDYKVLPDGTTVNKGLVCRLAKDWLIDSSPPSAFDALPEPKTGVPQPDELDYALLRLERALADEPVGGDSAEPGASPRGFIDIPRQPYAFAPDSPLFIVQHPLAGPLKLALDSKAVIGCNANGTRVTYRTNTDPGSSGAPVFNSSWQLVALHHSGDPTFTPTYNEGIPAAAILELLAARNLAGAIGAPAL